jgi:hypothetical protein
MLLILNLKMCEFEIYSLFCAVLTINMIFNPCTSLRLKQKSKSMLFIVPLVDDYLIAETLNLSNIAH